MNEYNAHVLFEVKLGELPYFGTNEIKKRYRAIIHTNALTHYYWNTLTICMHALIHHTKTCIFYEFATQGPVRRPKRMISSFLLCDVEDGVLGI